jgi:serine/threonine protein kinase
MPDLSGYSFGRYHLIEQLGEGGMATVYKAYDTRLERDVAVKILRTEQFSPAQLEEVLQRFDREAKSLGKLSHPNIVSILDYGEYESVPYLVMEYLPGGTLKKKLGAPLAWRESVGILLPVARALAYAHQHGVIHRDIKPANILLKESGDPILTDFGIAKLLEGVEGHTLTASGVGIGTPEYMAPEQGMGAKVDARADIYSLGTVLYELVTGRKPYIADTPMAVLLKHMTDALPPPRKFIPDLPEQAEKVLLKSMAKAPEDRYETMADFVCAMEGLLKAEKQSQTKIRPPAAAPAKQKDATTQKILVKQSPAPAPQKNLTYMAVIGGAVMIALLCLVFGFGAYYLMIPDFGGATIVSNPTAPSEIKVIPTPTATKPPPFTIKGCNPTEECPEAITVWDMFPKDTTLDYNVEYKTSISPQATLRLYIGWCAADTKTLDENLTQMEYVFTIDGVSVINQIKTNRFTDRDENDPNIEMYCDSVGGTINGWTPGQTYRIVFGFKIKNEINDGWDIFPPADHVRIFLITADPNAAAP